ncbi:protein translocase subunit SecD [Paraneptunicella aestuarii]|uniref:protein translocase subunit SecD n=1 Tax=Paraneptunicella aestuarii TaxID=2831148 RepID=UPI001E3D52CD|nr:protein translocase subunit SecD [Paraneptunicella aestuarii]UAA37428.1 protein translocase subunit SecD [Paraneptunicella aestuarii]
MLNHTPLWKSLLILVMVSFFALFALPNLYGEDYAIQISTSKSEQLDTALLDQVNEVLKEANVVVKAAALNDTQILVRFSDDSNQRLAKETLDRQLEDKYTVALNLAPNVPDWLKMFGASPMKLGLDLRGGIHFLMEVDMETAIDKALDDLQSDMKTSLREEDIRYKSVKKVSDYMELTFRDEEALDKAVFNLKRKYPGYEFSELDGLKVTAKMSEQQLAETKSYAVQQNITIMRNRVNQLGVAEPVVQRQGAERIVIQLPGIQDSAKAKDILGATATLEYRAVDYENDVIAAAKGRVPAGSEVINDTNGRPVLLKKEVIAAGKNIVDAQSGIDQYGLPKVSISLDSKGGAKMSRFTKKNIGNPMAVVFIEYKPTDKLDKNGKVIFEKERRVINQATIRGHFGSKFETTGLDSPAEAQNLALLLRAGSLIAPIRIVEERTIGPSLGKENIANGMDAIMLGFILVIAFMVLYYKKFGLVANIALAANLIMIVGIMSLIPGATLTLPGMAGIVLTVGMAVDANVLIFERIREELREGRSPQHAISSGYDNAFSTILDANITTLIAAAILFAIGTGPIKGFSVTLMIGIITSMFTAIILTRAVVNTVWGGKRLEKLPI